MPNFSANCGPLMCAGAIEVGAARGDRVRQRCASDRAPQDVAPVLRHEVVVEQDRRIDFDRYDVAGTHDVAPPFLRQNLLGDGHSHE
jgi:hypothetical protein